MAKADRAEAQGIIRGFQAINRDMKARILAEAGKKGFSYLEYVIFSAISDFTGLTLQELSTRLGLPNSTVSRIIDRLVKRGRVEREVPGDDRRTVRLSLSRKKTQRGRISDALGDELSGLITDKEAREINAALIKLGGAMEKIRIRGGE
jgi:DNA-binding MarR family transcriptional regulator